MSLAENKIDALLGLARKAGKTAAGEFSTEKAIREGRAALVIVPEDASDNTKKKFGNLTTHFRVPIVIYGNKEALGHAIGCQDRSSLAVLDRGFAGAIENALNNL